MDTYSMKTLFLILVVYTFNSATASIFQLDKNGDVSEEYMDFLLEKNPFLKMYFTINADNSSTTNRVNDLDLSVRLCSGVTVTRSIKTMLKPEDAANVLESKTRRQEIQFEECQRTNDNKCKYSENLKIPIKAECRQQCLTKKDYYTISGQVKTARIHSCCKCMMINTHMTKLAANVDTCWSQSDL